MEKLYGLVLMILGGLIVIGAAITEVAWLGFCFGTIIVGLLLLFFMPGLLFAPFNIGFLVGSPIFINGLDKVLKEF